MSGAEIIEQTHIEVPAISLHSVPSNGAIELQVLDSESTGRQLHRPDSRDEEPLGSIQGSTPAIDRKGLWYLALQHLSSAWGVRTAEFAFYLYLIELFQTTLLPASLYGFFTTAAGILFAGAMGSLVDRTPKLTLVRSCILAQKLSAAVAYACYLVLFATSLKQDAAAGTHAASHVWILFSIIVFTGSVLNLSTIAISVAVERDWATCIADGDDGRLTRLNTILRRIDLLCKLMAPLFVSLLTTAASYTFSVVFLGCLSLIGMVFEFIWIQIVYNRIPVLATDEAKNREKREEASLVRTALRNSAGRPKGRIPSFSDIVQSARKGLQGQVSDWVEFIKNPIFPSSLSISLLYLTVLSFDGTMLSYLKTHNFSDPFIAGMRGICVVTGLLGTFVMPFMEKRLGLVRAGSWAIWSEVVSLLPVLLSFYVGAPIAEGQRGPAWNAVLLFGGMAVSRVGLWAFDLCQLKELQTTLADHPRRNKLSSLQFALQNIGDVLKYVLTIILSRPSQFRWAALASFISVSAGAVSYMVFVRRVRGHLVHFEYLQTLLGKTKAG